MCPLVVALAHLAAVLLDERPKIRVRRLEILSEKLVGKFLVLLRLRVGFVLIA